LEIQKTTRAALDGIEARLDGREDRMTHLEAGQGRLVAGARGAAAAAAAGLAGSVIAEVVTRLTRVEMRQDDMQARLPPAARP
jgi:outer membrane lipoprotein SlyB